MAAQTRTTAVFRLVNRLAGTTPGRAFQISTSRAAGHCSASLVSSFAVAKRSTSGALLASFAVAKAVMLFSLLIVEVTFESPVAVFTVIRNFITQAAHTSSTFLCVFLRNVQPCILAGI